MRSIAASFQRALPRLHASNSSTCSTSLAASFSSSSSSSALTSFRSASSYPRKLTANNSVQRLLPSRSLLSASPSRHAHFDATAGLSESQKEFQKVALDFAKTEMLPHAAKWDRTHFFPVDVLRGAAALGFGGIYCKEDVGGAGLGRTDAAVVFEALSTACVSTTAYLTIHNMAIGMIDEFGSEEQRHRYLPELTSMKKMASYCLTEPNAGSDAGSLQTRAVKQSNGTYKISGAKAFISGGGTSDVYVVMARTGSVESGAKGVSAFILEKGMPGLSFGANENKLGWNSSPTAAVLMDEVVVEEKQRVGKEGQGFGVAMRGLDCGRLNISATSLGGAWACLQAALDHVQVRKQFGQPLANFQNNQFHLADMATELSAARLLVHHAAKMVDDRDPAATVNVAMAKRFATDIGFNVCNRAMQMFGGYGYLKDYPVERYLRDVRVSQILEGTNEVMRIIISRHLLKS